VTDLLCLSCATCRDENNEHFLGWSLHKGAHLTRQPCLLQWPPMWLSMPEVIRSNFWAYYVYTKIIYYCFQLLMKFFSFARSQCIGKQCVIYPMVRENIDNNVQILSLHLS
jgi:hypothetical protein